MVQIELKLLYADKVNPGFWALFEGKELKKGWIMKDENSRLYQIKVQIHDIIYIFQCFLLYSVFLSLSTNPGKREIHFYRFMKRTLMS